jgi:hypothetical protein
MALIRRFGRRLCDDRVLALRSLALHHRTPMGLGTQGGVAAAVVANLLICGLVMHNFAPGGDREAAVLFFLGETAVMLGFFVIVVGPSIAPILDRADVAGLDTPHQQRFVLLEFAAHPMTLAIGISVTAALLIILWPRFTAVALVPLLMLSWLVASAATALSFIVIARAFNVTPGAIALGCLVLLMLIVLGPLAVTGEPILSYLPLCGWTTHGVVALQSGDLSGAFLWTTLQFLAAGAVMVGLRGRRDEHAPQA